MRKTEKEKWDKEQWRQVLIVKISEKGRSLGHYHICKEWKEERKSYFRENMENIRQKRKILRGEKIECKNKDKLGKKMEESE